MTINQYSCTETSVSSTTLTKPLQSQPWAFGFPVY